MFRFYVKLTLFIIFAFFIMSVEETIRGTAAPGIRIFCFIGAACLGIIVLAGIVMRISSSKRKNFALHKRRMAEKSLDKEKIDIVSRTTAKVLVNGDSKRIEKQNKYFSPQASTDYLQHIPQTDQACSDATIRIELEWEYVQQGWYRFEEATRSPVPYFTQTCRVKVKDALSEKSFFDGTLFSMTLIGKGSMPEKLPASAVGEAVYQPLDEQAIINLLISMVDSNYRFYELSDVTNQIDIEHVSYATFGRRLGSGILGFLISSGLFSLMVALTATEGEDLPVVTLIIGAAIFLYWHGISFAVNKGRRLLHIKVVNANGKNINIFQAILRFIVSIPLFFLEVYIIGLVIDYLIYRKDSKKRLLIDLICGTVAVDINSTDTVSKKQILSG